MEFDPRRARAVLRELELRKARDNLAVYAGLQIPADIEADEDLPGQDRLPIAARYVPAAHHRLMIEKLEALERGYVVEKGKKVPFKRLAVFMPPGSAKSTYGSVIFPPWYMGKHPKACILQGSYNEDLASRFGRRARNTFDSDVHREVFPESALDPSSKAAGDWGTAQGGEYYSFGFKTGIAGRRADGVIIDDPIKGRAEADSKNERERVWETYTSDVRPRLKPGAWVLYVATRWHEDDPAGRILPKEAIGRSGWFTAKDGERWYVLSLAAMVETEDDARHDVLGRKVGEILWPEWFTKEMMLQERRTQGQRNWSALYQQRPRPDEGSILYREYWRPWVGEKPELDYKMQIYDTAFEEEELGIGRGGGKKKSTPDYSARTTWGVFMHMDEGRKTAIPCAILLEAWRDRVGFPELRRLASEEYRAERPNRVLIEKKASGHSLVQELKKKGIPVTALKVTKGKTARAHAAAAVAEQGSLFYMASKNPADVDDKGVRLPKKDLVGVIDECTEFPYGAFDDWTDTVVNALLWLRKTMWVKLPGEEDQDDEGDNNPGERNLFG